MLDPIPASHPVKVVVEIGDDFSLHTAASAKALLAYRSGEAQKAFVRTFPVTKKDAPYADERRRVSRGIEASQGTRLRA